MFCDIFAIYSNFDPMIEHVLTCIFKTYLKCLVFFSITENLVLY